MSQTLSNYVDVCKEAINSADSTKLDIPKPSNIIFTGMGGSGISGNLVKDVIDLDIPVEVSKGYTLPTYANSNTLVICVSYSGNTEETLSQFVKAVKRKCSIVSVSSGGKLLEWSRKLGIPFIQVPAGYQPREAIPYLFFSVVSCLEKVFLKNLSEDKKEFLDLIPRIDLLELIK